MSQVTILVKNNSGASHSYFLFVKAPEVFSNVYIAAPPTPSGNGTAKFIAKKDYFAVCGTNPGQQLRKNVQVTTGDWGIAKLNQGGKLGSSFTMTGADGGAAFDGALLKQACSQPGSFSIESTNFLFGNGSNQFVGLGAQDPMDATNIVPVATFLAQPNTTSYIRPRNQYYISWGTYVAGEIIDVTTIAEPCEIDFTGKAATLAKVEHRLDGTWAITFN
ncbi:uncharacterized protein B0I36DRAFT_349807 [Microdochium trichocladiopsis]|uniref:Uncharacterized protein n=1 Tax=Microdochium trichocladiopsis TaxID=1682393 RepID=A0A9P8Y4C2_9PEZI|nr:uncharacterized protein B0I36DRAFT_349807 [Microdochium trichocladiopsis]KAH7028815.1 hypothetical protein B0I36DRAFT_349807 [Microdochium trichocladiopsis]